MAVLAGDTYPDIDGTDLTAHVIQGPNVLGYGYTAPTSDYEIWLTSIRNSVLSPSRCRIELDSVDASNFVLNWGDFFRGSPDAVGQGCAVGIACDDFNAAYDESGIWAEAVRADAVTMALSIVLTGAGGGVSRSVSVNPTFGWIPNTGVRLEVERISNIVTLYTSDLLTGLNRVNQGSLTLTGPEQAFYDDGNHQDAGLYLLGPGASQFFVSEFELSSTVITQTSVIDFESLLPVPVSQSAVLDWEQILTIPVSQSVVIGYELTAPAVVVSQQAIVDYESYVFKKLFCPEPAPTAVVTTCPTARTIKCIRGG